MIGVIVDRIDKVVGIHSSAIQPPHPIFGDINIKYISGVVENEGRLYIILDVERILGKSDAEDQSRGKPKSRTTDDKIVNQSTKKSSTAETKDLNTDKDEGKKTSDTRVDTKELNKKFIAEALEAIEGFFVTSLNSTWFTKRFDQWFSERGEDDCQVQTQTEAMAFIDPFYSPYTGKLWGDDYAAQFEKELPSDLGKQINVWNPGCGKGYETYCLAAILRKKYPDVQIKIWASDKDLLNISGAPTMVFQNSEIPRWCREFMIEGKNGLSFNQKIKDSILFEYHDITNTHSMPPIQLFLARDLFSFLKPSLVERIFEDIKDRVKGNGILCLGQNETPPPESGWVVQDKSSLGFSHKG
jgi:purine-binding chemotaxis protein CheW